MSHCPAASSVVLACLKNLARSGVVVGVGHRCSDGGDSFALLMLLPCLLVHHQFVDLRNDLLPHLVLLEHLGRGLSLIRQCANPQALVLDVPDELVNELRH